MIENQEFQKIKEFKKNVVLVKDLKDRQLVIKFYPKNENKYSSIYLREIEALKRLQHPNIVKIQNAGEEDKHYYILFEYIDGKNFVEHFKNLNSQASRCSFLKSIIKILETLEYIHAHDCIHGDIKPSNVIVDYNNNPFILDFGVSTISNTITKTQQELSLWYASPEQKNNEKIQDNTDLYSLGIMLLETLISEDLFEQFKQNIICIDEAVDAIKLFDSGVDESLKNIVKRLTYTDKNQRYQKAKDVILDIRDILSFFNCGNEYELHLSDSVKKQLEEDFEKPAWEILEFIQDKINQETKYIEYGKDKEEREEIKLATKDFIFYCGIGSENHFFVFRYSQRVPESIKQNGQIINDRFVLTHGRVSGQHNPTYMLIDGLESLKKSNDKKKEQNQKKKDFLTKTQKQLNVERKILDAKNISMYVEKMQHKKGKRELIAKVINLENVQIKEEHLRGDVIQNEEFVQKLFEGGFINDPNNQDVLKVLNNLIKNYFFETCHNDIVKKLYEKNKEKSEVSINKFKSNLASKYQGLNGNLKKMQFNAELIFSMYKDYLIKQKEKTKYFSINDEVFVEEVKRNTNFRENFIVQSIDIQNKQIILSHTKKEISKIPQELKISFDYERSTAVLRKQEWSIKDLKRNNTTIDNLLDIIANPNSLAQKREIPKCGEYINKNIDKNQQKAVDKALSLERGEYLLIQGPPGTGKTTVITEIVNQILKTNKLAKILVTSQSNQAVDNVLEKICEIEDKIVRFGEEKKLSCIAKEYHEEQVFYKYLQIVKARLEQDSTNYFIQNESLSELHEQWKHHILQGSDELKSLLFKKIRVIFGTLVGISSWQDFRNIEFDYVIVDEAGRANLAELMIPLRRAKRFILVGDHKQLPPVVEDEVVAKMKEYNKKDLEVTLFEELYEKIRHDDFKHFLKYNYRSNKNIAKLYSQIFYEGKIKTKNFLRREHDLDFEKKVYFYSTSKLDKRFDTQSGTGKKNNANRDVIIKIILEIQKQTKEKDLKKSVGIITPYLAQRDNIKSKFGQIKNELTNIDVEINSVDAFQGSDRDIIIYDIVRSQKDNKANIEFVSDEKRLNVALSRTKELLFIVGNAGFIYDAKVKDRENPFKEMIDILNQDKENYEIKELKNEK